MNDQGDELPVPDLPKGARPVSEEVPRLKRALELALYYVEGDSVHDVVKARCNAIISGAIKVSK